MARRNRKIIEITFYLLLFNGTRNNEKGKKDSRTQNFSASPTALNKITKKKQKFVDPKSRNKKKGGKKNFRRKASGKITLTSLSHLDAISSRQCCYPWPCLFSLNSFANGCECWEWKKMRENFPTKHHNGEQEWQGWDISFFSSSSSFPCLENFSSPLSRKKENGKGRRREKKWWWT